MKLEIEVRLDPIQMRQFKRILAVLVEKEVQRQLKFKRNEVLKDGN